MNKRLISESRNLETRKNEFTDFIVTCMISSSPIRYLIVSTTQKKIKDRTYSRTGFYCRRGEKFFPRAMNS